MGGSLCDQFVREMPTIGTYFSICIDASVVQMIVQDMESVNIIGI